MRPLGVGVGISPIDASPLEPPITTSTIAPLDDYDDYEDYEDEDSKKWDPH